MKTNHYCTKCSMTTQHDIKGSINTCKVCGVDKYRHTGTTFIVSRTKGKCRANYGPFTEKEANKFYDTQIQKSLPDVEVYIEEMSQMKPLT